MIDYISIPYLLIAILSLCLYYLANKDGLFLSNNFLLGLVAALILMLGIGNFAIELYSGYFYESFAFKNRMYGQWFYLRILLVTLAVVLPIFNFRKRFRKNHKFQYIIFSIYSALVIFNFLIGEINTVAPGWQTTIYPQPGLLHYALLSVIGLIINFLIVKFKLLPEFRKETTTEY